MAGGWQLVGACVTAFVVALKLSWLRHTQTTTTAMQRRRHDTDDDIDFSLYAGCRQGPRNNPTYQASLDPDSCLFNTLVGRHVLIPFSLLSNWIILFML